MNPSKKKLLSNSWKNVLKDRDILSNNQYGFWKLRSTITAGVKLVNGIIESLECKRFYTELFLIWVKLLTSSFTTSCQISFIKSACLTLLWAVFLSVSVYTWLVCPPLFCQLLKEYPRVLFWVRYCFPFMWIIFVKMCQMPFFIFMLVIKSSVVLPSVEQASDFLQPVFDAVQSHYIS